MTTQKDSLKMTASALAAVFVTILLTLTFMDSTNFASIHRDSSSGFLMAIGTLVR